MLVLGPIQNNVYFLIDEESKDCVIIDPSFNADQQLQYLTDKQLKLRQIWVTHGHYDHFIGVGTLNKECQPLLFGMNPTSYAYAQSQNLRYRYGEGIEKLPKLDLALHQGDALSVCPEASEKLFEVREVPGHCPGSVIFYCQKGGFAMVGDAIFRGSIGRTDLEGGDETLLLRSIREQIFSLPPETVLFPGHGEQTTVDYERKNNPFLAEI